MDGEQTSTEVVKYAKKKIRLSQVVDKLAVIGNGNALADKENNNISEGQVTGLSSSPNEPMKQFHRMTPQLASTVPQTHQVVQQTASTVSQSYLSKMQTPFDMDANVSPVNFPQVGSTVPDIMPETGSTILQNFLLYGGRTDQVIPPPPPLYKLGAQPANIWQFYLNYPPDFNNTLIPKPEYFMKKAEPFQEEVMQGMVKLAGIKQETEDEDDGKMVIDESCNNTNKIQYNHKTIEPPINLDKNDEKEKPKASKKSTKKESENTQMSAAANAQQLYYLTPQLASTVPHTHQVVQQSATSFNIDATMTHLHLPAVPTNNRHNPINNTNQYFQPHQEQLKYYGHNEITNIPSQKYYKSPSPEMQYNMKQLHIIPKPFKFEPNFGISHGSHDTDSEGSWRGNIPSPQSYTMNYDQYQQVPLDLSVKGTALKKEGKYKIKGIKKLPREPKRSPSQEGAYPEVRGDVASPTTRETVAARYNMEVSPVVEQMPDGADTAWACPVCGQLFSQKDRLAKHVACRHRGRSPSRTHVCWSCNRGFSRSDMLTRHLRLHTGQKPYRCGVCGQIFSRSDHLATHRRTHTGEKPYKCPQCSYSACRRDMITRHMRTHRNPTSTSPTSSASTTSPPTFTSVSPLPSTN